MSELPERVARIEGTVHEIKDTVSSIKGYLERSGQERQTNHTLVIERLTKSEGKLDSMKEAVDKYQSECTSDRKTLEERMGSVESKQTWQQGVAAAIAFVVSGIAWGLDMLRKG